MYLFRNSTYLGNINTRGKYSVDINVSHGDSWAVSVKPVPPSEIPAPDDVLGIIAFRVCVLRGQRGWSQERFALEADLDRTYISGVERKRWAVTVVSLDKMAKALDREAWELLIPVDESELP